MHLFENIFIYFSKRLMWGRYALLLLDKKKLFPEKSQGLGFLSQAVGLLSQALGLFWEKLKNQYVM